MQKPIPVDGMGTLASLLFLNYQPIVFFFLEKVCCGILWEEW